MRREIIQGKEEVRKRERRGTLVFSGLVWEERMTKKWSKDEQGEVSLRAGVC